MPKTASTKTTKPTARKPARAPSAEGKTLTHSMRPEAEGAAVGAVACLEIGERVRVVAGPFGNSRGFVEGVRGSQVDIRVNGRTVITEQAENLAPVGP